MTQVSRTANATASAPTTLALPEIVGPQRVPSRVCMSARIGFVWSVSI